jgi:hypothetical protein
MKNVENGFFRYPIGGSNHHRRQAAIFLNGGSDRGDEIQSPDGSLWIEMMYVGGG